MDHASRSAFLYPSRRLRSGPVVWREFATSSKVRLLSFRWWPAVVYWRIVRLDGGHSAACDDCAKVSTAIESRLCGSSCSQHYPSAEEWNQNGGIQEVKRLLLAKANCVGCDKRTLA